MHGAPVGSVSHAGGSGPTGKFVLGSAPAQSDASAVLAIGQTRRTRSVVKIRPARHPIQLGSTPAPESVNAGRRRQRMAELPTAAAPRPWCGQTGPAPSLTPLLHLAAGRAQRWPPATELKEVDVERLPGARVP